MKRSERDRWTTALRSGEFDQGFGAAKTQHGKNIYHCAVGVKCVVEGIVLKEISSEICTGRSVVCDDPFCRIDVQAWGASIAADARSGCTEEQWWSVVGLNDAKRLPFSDIADWIEANIEVTEEDTDG